MTFLWTQKIGRVVGTQLHMTRKGRVALYTAAAATSLGVTLTFVCGIASLPPSVLALSLGLIGVGCFFYVGCFLWVAVRWSSLDVAQRERRSVRRGIWFLVAVFALLGAFFCRFAQFVWS